ncbi:hypothetical protein C8Q74DRAFT_220036 [Fomes fomentarius]|nr:hypothetical protein C8Q74DRAFT_220036 [Fomes fomentarius]
MLPSRHCYLASGVVNLTICFLPGGDATATIWANVLDLLSRTSSTLRCLKLRGLYTSEALSLESRRNRTSIVRGPCLNAGELKEVDSLLSDDRFKDLHAVHLTYLQVTKEQMEPSERRRIIADMESWMPQFRARKGTTLRIDMK